jgi:histidinol-phosphatase (PHP family)
MILADYHVHSEFSSDSQAPMEQVIERALELGLSRLCFTDHMDYDYPPVSRHDFMFDPEAYVKKLASLREQYHKKIEILTGIELGLQPHLLERLNSLINKYPFDFIIGSSHVVDHYDPYFPEYWEDKTKEQGITRYFESIIENCKVFHAFHVYGHIDYIIRYVPKKYIDPSGKSMPDYSYLDFSDLLDEVLKTILSYGRGIEVNSAGLKYGLPYPHPKAEILKRYRELGGELITIGSDAHKPEHLCYDFSLLPEYLKSLGFRYYAVFKQGQPTYEKL